MLWLKGEDAKDTELDSPDHPEQLSTAEKLPTLDKDPEKDGEELASDHSTVLDDSGRLEELRYALQQAEQQNQLLNSEYSKLLREKEVN